MVWGGTAMEGCTDIYRLGNSILTIRYQEKILVPMIMPGLM